MKDLQNKILEKFGIDKVLHLAFGATLFLASFSSLLGLSIFTGLPFNWFRSILISTTITIVAGILKELVYDKWMRGGKFDIKDVFATALGAPFGLFLFALFFGAMWCIIQVLHII